jgi:hypothetical protein
VVGGVDCRRTGSGRPHIAAQAGVPSVGGHPRFQVQLGAGLRQAMARGDRGSGKWGKQADGRWGQGLSGRACGN